MNSPIIGWELEKRGFTGVTVNPKLADYSFYRFFDAHSCFQKIQTYFSNFLTKLDESVTTTGDDKILAKQKGFDEMSFRTMAPGKKKLNRKENRLKKRQKE